jgi:signal transduction histidine kinase
MNTVPAAVSALRRWRLSPADALARARRSPLAFDAAFAVLMALVTVAGSLAESDPTPQLSGVPAGQHVPAAAPAAYLLVAGSALVLTWRRRRPVLVLAVSAAGAVAYTCLGYVDGAVLLNPVLALYAVAVATETRRAVALSILTMVALMAASAAFDPFGATGGGFILIPGEVAAALFLGLWVASRRAYALRDSEEQARRAVDAERLRIARELHDVVAHTMATINVQAGVAGHVIDQQPDQAAQALEAIKQASKDALRELRGILNVLRAADEHDLRAPAPRLDQLATLLQGITQAGLPCTVTVHGEPRSLAPTVHLAAYRIVQESLTNALRYAGPTTAAITLTYSDHHLDLEVLDNGRGHSAEAPQSGGHGIVGMRERAAAVGGSLQAGPRAGSGFRVHARLPLSPS